MDISLQVQVPSHSLSFEVHLAPGATVLDLKHAIHHQCRGAPSVDGQRLISKGRLLQNTDLVDSIWTSPAEARIVFASIHPSSWTSDPPPSPPSTRQENLSRLQQIASSTPVRTPTTQNQRRLRLESKPQPLAYIHCIHMNAIRAVLRAPLVSFLPAHDMVRGRNFSRVIVESYGYQWPSILDQDFPGQLSPTAEDEGVTYKMHYIEGSPYLRLSPESAGKTPTPLQKRALEILTYTFPLLHLTHIHPFDSILSAAPQPLSPNGVGAPRPAPAAMHWNQILPRHIQAFPFRALIGPLFMLCLRTTILLYIFTPSTPILAIVIFAWVAWEVWGVAQAIVVHEAAVAANLPNNANPNGGAVPPPNGGVANDDPVANGQGNVQVRNARGRPLVGINGIFIGNSPAQVLDKLAQFNLKNEERALFPPTPDSQPNHTRRLQQEPSPLHRVKMLVVLFVLTLHPGVWMRRRTSLRQREGNVKKELHERQQNREREEGGRGTAATPGEPVSEFPQRPSWLEGYIRRVEQSEWVDG